MNLPSDEDELERREQREANRFLGFWFLGWVIVFPICGYFLGGVVAAVIFLGLGFFVHAGMWHLFD
ncbi:hypothetical protein [Mariniblastus fucicola]|uniref:hypothetical protein n=1 Tax=Mariniblastus fucicola TaxID=980251 RepID=UPI0011DFF5FA|nr:hypothetical protein [Mariniblastus fucicola]